MDKSFFSFLSISSVPIPEIAAKETCVIRRRADERLSSAGTIAGVLVVCSLIERLPGKTSAGGDEAVAADFEKLKLIVGE